MGCTADADWTSLYTHEAAHAAMCCHQRAAAVALHHSADAAVNGRRASIAETNKANMLVDFHLRRCWNCRGCSIGNAALCEQNTSEMTCQV